MKKLIWKKRPTETDIAALSSKIANSQKSFYGQVVSDYGMHIFVPMDSVSLNRYANITVNEISNVLVPNIVQLDKTHFTGIVKKGNGLLIATSWSDASTYNNVFVEVTFTT